MKTIGVVTGSRADYGIYRPVLRHILSSPDLQLRLIVCGMHLSPAYGLTVRDIEADGFTIAARLPTLCDDDSPEGIGKSMGQGVTAFSEEFGRVRPDILLLLGDRYEMFAAAIAALPYAMPLAHIHGGELTEGLIDDAIRHSLTKMCHLHFVATEEYRRRVIQLGEAPDRVFTVGAPAIDLMSQLERLDRAALSARLGISLDTPPLLVTHHPLTLAAEQADAEVGVLLDALETFDQPIIITYPNADTRASRIIERIGRFAAGRANVVFTESLGSQAYFSVMAIAGAMVGNSSSGIIEAASFRLPVVNIGDRQRGRVAGGNVIHVPADAETIREAIRKALSPEFRESLADQVNPYGRGTAAPRIVEVLRSVSLGQELVMKRFHDLEACG
ncbi:UDP-N-acetylglucosamine 2-epimerase [Azospirillum soli]|uniref:UDP-N-acetylglucosamine 2-epimerase n=1 Tax=Azospirillum soli TaxID=1304799 RepID=UPI001AE51CB1|nr:UDP-N-acetylglucosamine 2-epimerase [Azospirillum soli]MBP2316261.1 UDP-hydrolyzing UDP-N-acetyl-D-glucosamine 2-epimerase [Azospirillum soli]